MMAPIQRRRGISTGSFLLGAVLWTLVIGALVYLRYSGGEGVSIESADDTEASSETESGAAEEPAEQPVVVSADEPTVRVSFPAKRLPDFEFDECMGDKVSRESLKGKRWVASFIFTRCASTCPMITKSVMDLQNQVGDADPNIRYVSFSVDPGYDTPAVMQKWSEIFTKGDTAVRERWKFVTGSEEQMFNLIRAGFMLYVLRTPPKLSRPGFEVAHSNRVVLVNEDGIPVATFLGTQESDMVELRRILQGKEPFPVPGDVPENVQSESAQPAVNLQLVPSSDASPGDDVPASDADDERAAADENQDDESVPANGGDRGSGGTGSNEGEAGEAADQVDAAGDGGGDAAAESASVNQVIEQTLPAWAGRLPAVNAGLNLLCTLLLLAGYGAIRQGRRELHRNLMISAFLLSVVFLACYLVYHGALQHFTGQHGRRFVGSDAARLLYFAILIPHVVLAVFV
ncbi:MAG: DUF420 domain-containing protein, partial [Planctomycetaceae bacterium]|nr:DUF420 domain-containing protein [Planctomycetaceae bacterium]